ncbi:hypothetical protein [Schlesneria sp. T3-172]|uniref:hypothetical protein n=1 Tax=Schlesneria sphaerica TaxID=3373610 RepID=UPI0037C75CC6
MKLCSASFGVETAKRDQSAHGSAEAVEGLGSSVSRSRCERFRDIILSKLEQGLDAQRICLNLVQEHGSDEKYGSVHRFVKSLGIWYAVSPGAFSQGGKYRQQQPVDADGNFEPQGKLCLTQPRAADAAPVAAMTRQPGLPSQGAIPS